VADFAEPVAVGDALYIECSADQDVGREDGPTLDDLDQVEKANPSFPHRTPPVSVARLRENMPDDDAWRREGLGVWDEDTEAGDLAYGQWLDLSDSTAARGDSPVFGVELVGERRVWLSVAWKRPDGSTQVMLANDGLPLPAHRAVVECLRLHEEWGGVFATSAFRDELAREGVRLLPMSASDFAAGCGLLADGITAATVRHGNQKALNAAVKAARWRPALVSGERSFELKNAPEVGPAASAARAVWGLHSAVLEEPAIY
jgi:hypothetical protein